jgi:GT2 family glycosyltransferase
MSSDHPDLSILVVNWNTRELLNDCLISIKNSVARIQYETIVVDNGSVDGSVELVRQEFPWVHLIENAENLGFGAANNQAMLQSRGRHVLLLNSDATIRQNSAEALVGVLDRSPSVAVVGGKLLNPDGTFQESFSDFPTLKSEMLILTYLARLIYPPSFPGYPAEQSRLPREVDWVNGAFLAARRTAIDEVGMFDTSNFMYGEEVDWCFRFRQADWSVFYEPSALAYHRVGGSANRVPERRRAMIFRGKWWFLRKHRGVMAATVYLWSARFVSALLFGCWTLRAAAGSGSAREYARAQAASFRYALRHLLTIR